MAGSSRGSRPSAGSRPAARVLRDHVARQVRVAGAVPDDRTVLDRDLPRPGGRDRPGGAHAVRRQAAPGAEAGLPGPAPPAAGDRGRLPPRRRRHLDSPAPDRRAAARPVRRPDRRPGRGPDPRRAGRQRPVRPPVPPERRPGPADAPARPGEADPALAPAAPGQGPAPGRPPAFPTSRSWSRPIANASTTTSTCPGSATFLDAIEAGTIRVVARDGEIPSPFASDLIFRFTAAYLYEWDEPRARPSGRGRARSTSDCSTPCSTRPRSGSTPARRPRRGPAPRRRPPAALGRRDGRDPPPPGRPHAERAGRADARLPRGAGRPGAGRRRSSWPGPPSPCAGSAPRKRSSMQTAFERHPARADRAAPRDASSAASS